jgi:hypothetical protein
MSYRPLALAVAVVLAACGSTASSQASDSTDPSTSLDNASSATSASTADTSATDATGGDSASQGDTTVSIDTVIAGFGLQPTPELHSCLEGEGVGAELTAATDQNQVTTALMKCAPEGMGAFLATGVTVPGLDDAKVKCVVVETMKVIGAMSSEEAAAAFESPTIPDGVRANVEAAAGPACGASAEQVSSVLDAQ